MTSSLPIESPEVQQAIDLGKEKAVYMKIIAIIPARSGSKGLKDKNIASLCGTPLIAYSIEAALGSGLFDTVHVSTDSEKYAEIAANYGADEPFLREISNSGDTSSSWDAVREVLDKYRVLGKEFDAVVLLQPTSPLRDAQHIKKAFDSFMKSGTRSLTSVTEVEHPVQWTFGLGESLRLDEFAKSPYRNSRRQELKKHYRENGAVFIVYTSDISDTAFDFYSDCSAYIMDRRHSIDIDTKEDLILAEYLMKNS